MAQPQPLSSMTLEDLYSAVFAEAGIAPGILHFVKRNEVQSYYRSILPPKTKMRQPAPGEMTGMQDKIDYLNSLVAESTQLVDLFPDLVNQFKNPRVNPSVSQYERALQFGRCYVRITEIGVDWELMVESTKMNLDEAKEILRQGYRPNSLTEDELQTLRDEINIWEEKYPPIDAARTALNLRFRFIVKGD
ncbi:uncharacterized protein GGS22DRAFT_192740 [Annulohypoxylon maeteangense]|uniref:uncharacterized protein n=1 Tax=Annulohypoxylon maeteangense TaxID=1927788 RepID=UPI002007209D|nr:uncharacterized protein GGS22DRAFT_192740 [Annulohypoxylon maeteangense]KAI0880904.1 hypothetical protein GGS22DRAFT_192740 [Annulohypoxylon maeteangense]